MKSVLKIKLLNESARMPERCSELAAGYDLYAISDARVNRGKTVMVGTGIAVEIPDGYFGLVIARSSVATKRGLRLAQGGGVIDADYRGEVMIPLHNDSRKRQYVKAGERIAQMIIIPHASLDVESCDELAATERGDGGFGSTGNM